LSFNQLRSGNAVGEPAVGVRRLLGFRDTDESEVYNGYKTFCTGAAKMVYQLAMGWTT
jgi:hypothetical protein